MSNRSTFFLLLRLCQSVCATNNGTARWLLIASFLFFSYFSYADQSNCPPSKNTQVVKIDYVIDGDTVRLSDGRRVRLIGINTPELGYKGRPDQPLAREAKGFVTRFFSQSRLARLQLGVEQKDHHGRWLGHLFNLNNKNLESALLAKGYAFHIAIPKNLSLAQCLARSEAQAKSKALGLWQSNNLSEFTQPKAGYRRITGTIKSIKFKHSWWISFEEHHLIDVVAVIGPKHQKYISRKTVQNWHGKSIEVEGWFYPAHYKKKEQLRVSLFTPHAITINP